jgi:transcriptional regulator with XRE-family HTH domain
MRGDRLREARKRLRLSQRELANQLGLTATDIYRVERGIVKDPHSSRVVAFAKALGVSTDYLLGLTDTADEPRWEQARRPPAPAGA